MKTIIFLLILFPLSSFSQTKDTVIKMAKDSLYNGNTEFAINLLTNYIKTDSSDADVYYLLADAKPTNGINELNKALSIDSTHVKSLLLRGQYFYFGGQRELAIKDYKRAYDISGDCQALSMAAKIKAELGNHKDAFLDYDLLLKQKDKNCSDLAHSSLAETYFLLGNYESVILEFKEFNIRSILIPNYYIILSESYLKTGRTIEACETIREIQEIWDCAEYKHSVDDSTCQEIERLIKAACH